MPIIEAADAYFIRLGRGSKWAPECLREGTLRFGYPDDAPHDICLAGDWDAVKEHWLEKRSKAGTATDDTRETRIFYETDDTAIFITFFCERLHWCRPSGPVELLPDQGRMRRTLDRWHSTSLGGTPLIEQRLSETLCKVKGYRRTICRVKPLAELLRKLGDEPMTAVSSTMMTT